MPISNCSQAVGCLKCLTALIKNNNVFDLHVLFGKMYNVE